MNIDGNGPKWLVQLFEKGLVHDVAEILYKVTFMTKLLTIR